MDIYNDDLINAKVFHWTRRAEHLISRTIYPQIPGFGPIGELEELLVEYKYIFIQFNGDLKTKQAIFIIHLKLSRLLAEVQRANPHFSILMPHSNHHRSKLPTQKRQLDTLES